MNKTTKGVTLVEILLILVIVAVFFTTGLNYQQQKAETLRNDMIALQMQYILNAALSYYIANGSWPPGGWFSELPPLVSAGYMPNPLPNNPYGAPYYALINGNNLAAATFVYSTTPGRALARANYILGKLPNTFSADGSSNPCTTATTQCWIYAQVAPPGQDQNNATAMNFAGLYHHGACVPVPSCPNDANNNPMTAQVFLVPISTSGVNDSGSTNVYPISSFTAYATASSASPSACNNESSAPACSGAGITNQYWRACMQVVTARGDVSLTRTDASASAYWGQYVTLLAYTRCSISNEPTGSGFTVYGN